MIFNNFTFILPDQAPLDGVLFVYKPAGITSTDCVRALKNELKVRGLSKHPVGHIGTLDPFAEGVLGVCIGEATKLSQIFLGGKKTYRATLQWGVQTDTGDHTGKVVGEMTKDSPFYYFSDDQIQTALSDFSNAYVSQIPPMYSAKKIEGETLYELARRGQSVARSPHPVTIYQARCLRIVRENSPGENLDLDEAQSASSKKIREIEIELECSGGTYVRTFAEDFAKAALKLCPSTSNNPSSIFAPAHLKNLVRSKVKSVTSEHLLTLPSYSLWIPLSQVVRPAFSADSEFSAFFVNASIATAIRQGKIHAFDPNRHALSREESPDLSDTAHSDPRIASKWAGAYHRSSMNGMNSSARATLNEDHLVAIYRWADEQWTFVRGFMEASKSPPKNTSPLPADH